MNYTPFIPSSVPQGARSSVARALGSVGKFAEMHQVQDKDTKKLRPFRALPMQTKIFAAVEAGHKRILIIKARQTAATTGAKMVLHHLATTTPNAAMHAVVSMREESASSLLDDNRRWLKHVPSLLTRPMQTVARAQIIYADTGASLQAFTSRSTTGLRSFTPAAAVISEAAFAPDLEEVLAQADAAVGDGLLILESTANNPNDFFSKLVRAAPENGWHLITMWWWEHPLYCDPAKDVPKDFADSLSDYEKKLGADLGLSLGQLHWRRRTELRLGSSHKFKREYPSCMDDCFLDREGGYFGDEVLGDIEVIEHALHGTTAGREIEPPQPRDRYVMGVDISGGVGGDYSTLCVVSAATRQVVYTERTNTSTPSAWAHRCIQVGSRYNQALILAESNNHGHAFLLEMNTCGYRALWLNPATGKPWVTTLSSKLDAYDTLRESLQLVRMLDRVTWLELRSLTIPPGKVAPEAPSGSYDDAAVACALAFRCLRDIPSSWRTAAVESNRLRVDDLLAQSRARRIRSSNLPF